MAGGEVGLGLRRGALGAHSVAHALVCALRLLPALLVAALVGAFARAARTLAGTGRVWRDNHVLSNVLFFGCVYFILTI